VEKGDVEQCKILLAQGADVNASFSDDSTPLAQAVFNVHEEIVELLSAQGADAQVLNRVDDRGRTMMHWAAENGRQGVLLLLFSCGADVVTDKEGRTPLDAAAYGGRDDAMDLLEQYNAEEETTAPTWEEMSPAEVAKPTAALVEKGHAMKQSEYYDEALACFDQALEVDSLYAPAWFAKGTLLRQAGIEVFDECIDALETAVRLGHPQAEYAIEGYKHQVALEQREEGDTLRQAENYDEAIACYSRAVELAPDSADLWSLKGATLAVTEDWSGALTCFENAHRLGDPQGAQGITFARQALCVPESLRPLMRQHDLADSESDNSPMVQATRLALILEQGPLNKQEFEALSEDQRMQYFTVTGQLLAGVGTEQFLKHKAELRQNILKYIVNASPLA